mmetsp:Transcript_29947/g.85563  ORF Transcript_29947/g.85563 Transcript_29947/m.85563 type:complete len:200 (-) Transcript_29947:663-1262(-)
MLSFSLAAKSRTLFRKLMSFSSFLECSYESIMNVAWTLLITVSGFGWTSTIGFDCRICRPSKVSLMMFIGFLLAFRSPMSFLVIELQACSASCRKGRALSNSTCASAFSLEIPSAVCLQSAFCALTSSFFLSALVFSPCTFTSSSVVFFSSTLSTTSCSLSCTLSFSTNSDASLSFSSPTFTLLSCTLISLYFASYRIL